MSLFKTTLKGLTQNKKNVEKGQLNSIPFPFKRFNSQVPGIIKGTNIIVTAGLKKEYSMAQGKSSEFREQLVAANPERSIIGK